MSRAICNVNIKADLLYGCRIIRPEMVIRLEPMPPPSIWARIIDHASVQFIGGIIMIATFGGILGYLGMPAEILTQLSVIIGFMFGFGFVMSRT